MIEDMKPSQFNVLFEYGNEQYVTNTFSKAIARINATIKHALQSGNMESIDGDTLSQLEKQGFVTEDAIDEIGLLRFAYEQSKYSPEDMEFVVAPTLQCNFGCPYCFEAHHDGAMSPSIQDSFLTFFEKKVSIERCKQVFFVWFGGEPLLYPEIICSLTPKLFAICKKYDVDIFTNVITNGYLLSREVASKLEKCGIEHLQVTIDGDKETHDARRVLKNGQPTFDQILENLANLKDFNLTVAVRVNIDSANMHSFEKVSSLIASLDNPKIICHPAIVVPAENQSPCQRESCLSRADMRDYYQGDVKSYYLERRSSCIQSRVLNCGAEHFYSYVIDEKGLVYKCWNSIGYENLALCSIDNELDRNPRIVSTYLGRDPFSEPECSACAFLPICSGGCYEQYRLMGTHECPPERYLLDSIIKEKLLSPKTRE